MSDPVDDHDEVIEEWFREHMELYHGRPKQEPPRQTRRKKRRLRPKPPIKVGKKTKKCRGCGLEAALEMFRKKRCLACQVARFLGIR